MKHQFVRAAPRMLILLVWLLTFAESNAALEIKEVRWGFDGRIVPERFNILSVLVDNTGRGPEEEILALEESRGMESRVGAPFIEPVYLTPGTTRWVQFYPLVSAHAEWKLRWGRFREKRYDVEKP